MRPLIGIADNAPLDGRQEAVLGRVDLRLWHVGRGADGLQPGFGAVMAHWRRAHHGAAGGFELADAGGVERVQRGDHGAVQRGVELSPFARGHHRAGSQAHRLEQGMPMPTGSAGNRLRPAAPPWAFAARPPRGAATGPASATSARAYFSIAPASTSLASACVGTPKPGTSMPMMRTPLICWRQQLQRHAAGGGHAQVDDDDGVVAGPDRPGL